VRCDGQKFVAQANRGLGLLIEPRVLDCDRDPAGQFFGQGQVRGVEARLAAAPAQRDGAKGAAAHADGDDHAAGGAHGTDQAPVLIVDDVPIERGRCHLGDQNGLTCLDDLGGWLGGIPAR
jgi:hypothetical protein